MTLTFAVSDTAVDAMMVQQSRLDPISGSEDLQSFCWVIGGIAGVFGYLFGGLMANIGHSMKSTFVTAGFGIIVAVTGFLQNPKLEQNAKDVIAMGMCERFSFTITEIKKAFETKELHRTFLLFVILGLIPSFGEYMYFYQIDVLGFSNQTYAFLQLIGFVGIFLGSLLFKSASKLLGMRAMIVIACLVNFIGAIGQLLFVRGVTLGMSPFAFISIINLFTDAVYFAFETMTAITLIAKIIPQKVEASMYSLFMGLLNLSYWFLARMLGNLANIFFGVTSDNLDDLWKLYLVQCICALVPICFVWLLPTQEEIKVV